MDSHIIKLMGMKSLSLESDSRSDKNHIMTDKQYIDEIFNEKLLDNRPFELQEDMTDIAEEDDEHEQDFQVDENTPWLTDKEDKEDTIDPNDDDDDDDEHSSQYEMSRHEVEKYIKKNHHLKKKKHKRTPSYAQDDVINTVKPPPSKKDFSKRKSDSFFMHSSGALIPRSFVFFVLIFCFFFLFHIDVL